MISRTGRKFGGCRLHESGSETSNTITGDIPGACVLALESVGPHYPLVRIAAAALELVLLGGLLSEGREIERQRP